VPPSSDSETSARLLPLTAILLKFGLPLATVAATKRSGVSGGRQRTNLLTIFGAHDAEIARCLADSEYVGAARQVGELLNDRAIGPLLKRRAPLACAVAEEAWNPALSVTATFEQVKDAVSGLITAAEQVAAGGRVEPVTFAKWVKRIVDNDSLASKAVRRTDKTARKFLAMLPLFDLEEDFQSLAPRTMYALDFMRPTKPAIPAARASQEQTGGSPEQLDLLEL
jgi:hypothetical protein